MSGGNGLWNGLGMYPTFFCEAGRGICGRKTSYLHGDRVSERIPDNGSEAAEAVQNGAAEIDMVINIGWAKAKSYDAILQEINAVKDACGEKRLKVIIETCLLTEEEKIALCDVVSRSRAEFIKTSTGFAGGGATLADIRLFKKYVTGDTKIKAAGGIKSVADAEAFLAAGADRLGSSSLLAMLRQEIKQ